ncbi:MAG: methylenetetrahydrofolate reductase [Candidatus Saelkia tenebricola]|nr:methylenetetrahydrofolate reductase [Candidatus Saelkia tenebricola]
MSELRQLLEKGEFVVTAEIAPPKGTDISDITREIDIYKQSVRAVNITDNQSSVMRASVLAIADILIKNNIQPIYQITARDRNRLGIQSDLLGASILGVDNVLCLTGDAIEQGDHIQAKAVFDVDSVQLIGIVEGLNKGYDSAGNKLNKPTNFFIGAACFPEASPLELEIVKTRKKVQSGACFLQSQAIYDVEKFKVFMDSIKDLNVYVLAGIVVLKSSKMAEYMNKNVSGINIPQDIIEEMKSAANQVEKGVEIAVRLIVELKKFAHGVHVMALGKAESVPKILKLSGLI